MFVIVTPNLGSSIYTSGLSIHEKSPGARNLTITKSSRAFRDLYVQSEMVEFALITLYQIYNINY